MSRNCPICNTEGYSKREGCEKCGHYDEYYAKRKLKRPTRAEKRLDRRFR